MANDLMKYATERIMQYLGASKDERLQRKVARKATREPWQSRWFGMLPISYGVWKERKKAATKDRSAKK